MGRRQAVLVAVLFGAGFCLSLWAARESRRSGRIPQFYQNEFTPAVMLACGRGYQNVAWRGQDRLVSFLLVKSDELSCGELPEGRVIPLDAFQRISPYLEYAVAATWRVFGVSWKALTLLCAACGGILAVVTFGILRLGLGSPLAFAATVAALTSPIHLAHAPDLRDYAKAPFILALVLIMGITATRTLTLRRFLLLMGAAGAVAGIGLGFRTDILLLLPLFAISVLCFRNAPEASARRRIGVGACGVAAFLLAFAFASWPVIRGYSQGGNTPHVAILGLSSFFDAPLGVEARHYAVLPIFLDGYEEALVRDYARRTSAVDSRFVIGSTEYDRQSFRYLWRVVATFPADPLIRWISSIGRTVDMGFGGREDGIPQWLRASFAGPLFAARQRVAAAMSSLGLVGALLVALGLLAADLRTGLFFIVVTLFLSASAALQFAERHYFYLEFVGWWMIALAGAGLVTLAVGLVSGRSRPAWFSMPRLLRAAALLVVIAGAVVLTLHGARRYQQRSFEQLATQYLSAPAVDLPVTRRSAEGGRLLLAPALGASDADPAARSDAQVRAEYLRLDVDPARCDRLTFEATVRYRATSEATDFTQPLRIPLTSTTHGAVTAFLPVFPGYDVPGSEDISSRFDGIEVEPDEAPCLGAIRRVVDPAAGGLLMTAILSSDWRAADHYQTMTGVERRYDGEPWATTLYSGLPRERLNRSLLDGTLEDVEGTVRYRAPSLRLTGRAADMSDRATGPYSYLLQTKGHIQPSGRYAVAEGQLRSGGLTFGLLRDESWYQVVNVETAGRFVAILETRDEGLFSIVLANQNTSWFGRTSFRIDRIGWVDAGR